MSTTQGISHSAERAAAHKPASPPAVTPKPASPPITPALPPQLVACGQRDFYRIEHDALQVFEVSTEQLPANIRGSRIARQMAQSEIEEPLSVLALEGKGALVISKKSVVRYDLGHAVARRYAGIDSAEWVSVWSDARDPNSFWVRDRREPKLRQYTLASPPNAAKTPAAAKEPEFATRAGAVEVLAEFDQRLFTRLADGRTLFSTPQALRLHGDKSWSAPLPKFAQPATLLFADSTRGRYWAADATGQLGIFAIAGGEPTLSSKVPGVVIDVAAQGERLAVLSVQLEGESYLPTVTLFEQGAETKRLNIAATLASAGQPKLDLCLLPDRPWVVVGGRRWLQLLDYQAQRLLSEW